MSRTLQWLSFGAVAYVFYVGSGGSTHLPDINYRTVESTLASSRSHIEKSIEKLSEQIPRLQVPPQATEIAAVLKPEPASGGGSRATVYFGLSVVALGVGEWVAEKYGHGVLVEGKELFERLGLLKDKGEKPKKGRKSGRRERRERETDSEWE